MILSFPLRISTSAELNQMTRCLDRWADEARLLPVPPALRTLESERQPVQLTVKAPWHCMGIWLRIDGTVVRLAPSTTVDLTIRPGPVQLFLLLLLLPVLLIVFAAGHETVTAWSVALTWFAVALEFYASAWVVGGQLHGCIKALSRAQAAA
jgi:hypothetical protein